MIDVGQEFVYLRNEAGLPDQSHLATRKASLQLPFGCFRVGIDAQSHKHALFPMGPDEPQLSESTAAVSLETRELTLEGTSLRFADLECTDPQLGLVFEHLVADVIERVEADPDAPARACLEALHEWRDLMRSAGRAFGRDLAVGLTGELECLRLLGARDPSRALTCWVGPSKKTHDFVAADRHLEVKTTSSVDGQSVRISNIDQLDPDTAPGGLHLFVAHCLPDESAATLDDRIRDLVARGFPKTKLIKAVADYGYVFEGGQEAPVFRVRSARLWSVGDEFPGLRSRDIPETRRPTVSKITYELSLAAAPHPVSESQLEEVLSSWCEE